MPPELNWFEGLTAGFGFGFGCVGGDGDGDAHGDEDGDDRLASVVREREEARVRHLGLVVALVATSSVAQDAYEIQVYNSDVAAKGVFGLELHANHVAKGASAGVSHLTLEPHVGLASWCEVGGYFQTILSADGHYDFAGVKARLKVRWPERLGGVLGLSLNTELSFGGFPATEGAATELRPIIDADFEHLYLSFNPIVELELSGQSGGRYSLEPAAKVGVKVIPALMLGAEYFGAFAPDLVGGPVKQSAQRLFGVVDAEWKLGRTAFEVNAGVGYGFVGDEKIIVKLTLAADFE